ncbi:MAG: PAS domain-containing sensor histidine kinase, partial [Pseudomarimonas sp.]
MPLTPSTALPTGLEAAHRRELYFFTLYRVLQAAMLVLATHGPFDGLVNLTHPLVARWLSLVYLLLAVVFLLMGRRSKWPLPAQVAMALGVDIAVALLAKYSI